MKAKLLEPGKNGKIDHDEGKSKLYDQTFFFQRVSGYLMLICAFAGLICLLVWMGSDYSGCFTGFDWTHNTFNYHPVFMYTGMIMMGAASIVSYRILPFSKSFTKALHAALHLMCFVFLVIGMTAIITSNNFKSMNDADVYYGNLYSLHSFLGLAAIALYFQNYVLGFYHFFSSFDLVPILQRKFYMPFHVFLGTAAFITSLFAVLTGIMELNTENGCSYSLNGPDLNPANHYNELSYGCRLANGVGILTLLVGLFGMLCLYTFPREMIEVFLSKNDDPSDFNQRFSSIEVHNRS